MKNKTSLLALLPFILNAWDEIEPETKTIKKWVPCPADCSNLSLQEKDQRSPKEKHYCTKYNKQVFHCNCEPKIFKCKECIEETEKKEG